MSSNREPIPEWGCPKMELPKLAVHPKHTPTRSNFDTSEEVSGASCGVSSASSDWF